MDKKPVSSRMYSLVVLYDMHTKFYEKAINGISAEDAHKRLDTKANHVAWIAGSMAHERAEMARLLGGDPKQDFGEKFTNHQSIIDDATYPSMSDYKKDWDTVTPIYREQLMSITDEKLDSTFEMPEFPEMSMPYFDLISFMIYREANMIGQIILWRRLLGYEGIKYDD